MASMNEMVSKVSVNKSSKAKEYAAASEWPKCSHAGCPLPTTIKADNQTCTYHYKEHGHNAQCITEAIKEHLGLINKHNELIFWNVRQWKDRKAQIMGWPILPATEQEMKLPTLYLSRLKTFIDKGIKERAEDIYQGKA
jgi:hypothetical protein